MRISKVCRFFGCTSISALIAASAIAQDVTEEMLNPSTAVAEADAPVLEAIDDVAISITGLLADDSEGRELPDDMDPVSLPIVRELDNRGFVKKRIDMGLDIKLMEDELSRVSGIMNLVDILGVDAFKRAFPDLYADLENSPAMIEAEIRYQELIHELEAARAGPQAEVEEASIEAEPRDDGSSFFMMPKPDEIPVGIDIPAPIAPSDEIDQEEDMPIAEVDIPISLREIYGIGDEFYAIILHGDEKIRVTSGDVLPGETEIRSVGDGYMDIIRRGEEIRIRIRG